MTDFVVEFRAWKRHMYPYVSGLSISCDESCAYHRTDKLIEHTYVYRTYVCIWYTYISSMECHCLSLIRISENNSLSICQCSPKPFLQARNFSKFWFFWSDFSSSSCSKKLEFWYNKKQKQKVINDKIVWYYNVMIWLLPVKLKLSNLMQVHYWSLLVS